jgi:hypothetical protein
MTDATNVFAKMIKFFGVTSGEFMAFYKGLTDEEKAEYKDAIAKWDGVSEFIS